MAKANEIKRGTAVSYNGKLLMVKDIDVQTPSARGPAPCIKCVLLMSVPVRKWKSVLKAMILLRPLP